MRLRHLIVLLLAVCALQAQNGRYYVVFLRPNPARQAISQEVSDTIQTAHMANMQKMARDGVLLSAGPFEDSPTTISGLFILHAESQEAARRIAERDPTVMQQRNTVDVHTWLGPAGIGDEYRKLHAADPSTPENMKAHVLCLAYRGPTTDERAVLTHLRFIDDLEAEGKLSAQGKVEGPDDLVSLVVFPAATSLEEAQRLLGAAAWIREGKLRLEYHRWWSADHVLPR